MSTLFERFLEEFPTRARPGAITSQRCGATPLRKSVDTKELREIRPRAAEKNINWPIFPRMVQGLPHEVRTHNEISANQLHLLFCPEAPMALRGKRKREERRGRAPRLSDSDGTLDRMEGAS